MSIKTTCAGIGALALTGGLAACGTQAATTAPAAAPRAAVTVTTTPSMASPAPTMTVTVAPPSATATPSGPDGLGVANGVACTTVAGYYPGGLPGHLDSAGFCMAGPVAASAQAPQLIRIQQDNMTDETIYHNYWSDGSSTTCLVHVFDDGVQSANGDCAPDGIANGMTNPGGGNPGPN
jgi:hypothetical protein